MLDKSAPPGSKKAHQPFGGKQVAHNQTFGGDIGSDECVLVSHIATDVPDTSGALWLNLELDGPVHATNAYATDVR